MIEPVGHRQLVFVLPKHLRRPFYRDRKLLTGLCRSAVKATHAFYRAGLGRNDLRVGMVVVPQRFGDKVNPHIHLHALATDGVFDKEGVFHPMPFDIKGGHRGADPPVRPAGARPDGASQAAESAASRRDAGLEAQRILR